MAENRVYLCALFLAQVVYTDDETSISLCPDGLDPVQLEYHMRWFLLLWTSKTDYPPDIHVYCPRDPLWPLVRIAQVLDPDIANDKASSRREGAWPSQNRPRAILVIAWERKRVCPGGNLFLKLSVPLPLLGGTPIVAPQASRNSMKEKANIMTLKTECDVGLIATRLIFARYLIIDSAFQGYEAVMFLNFRNMQIWESTSPSQDPESSWG